jgi:hypothetical protein
MNHKHGQEKVLNAAEAHDSSLFSIASEAGSALMTSSKRPNPCSPQCWLQSSLNGLIDKMGSQMLGPF